MSVNVDAFEVVESTPEGRDTGDQARLLARKLLEGMAPEQRLALAGAFIRKDASDAPALVADAPQTPDELWDYIKDTYSIEIPRVAVCPDHDAPFDFFCAVYFEEFPSVFRISSRGGGKSFGLAVLHHVMCRFTPGVESVTFGAVEHQAKRVYASFRRFLNMGLPDGSTEIVGDPKISETIFINGSKLEIFTATLAATNGPHPQRVHSDEVEIMRADAWGESRQMASDKVMPDGRRIKGTNIGTSTRKWKNGRVDKIYQAFIQARAESRQMFGRDQDKIKKQIVRRSPFYCFVDCIYENAQQVPNCRQIPKNFSLPEHDTPGLTERQCKCDCDQYVHGRLDDDSPRTLESVCKGRLYRSRGFRTLQEIQTLFMQSEPRQWAAQQECSEADDEGVYVAAFSRRRHGLSFFPIDPANGPFYTSTDWGTVHFACVLFAQYLERAVEAISFEGNKIVVPARSRVIISEIYEDGLTSAELGEKTIIREVKLAQHTSFSRLPIRKRWADVQGAGDRRVWRKMGLQTSGYGSRVFSEHIKEVRGKYEADRCFVVVPECQHYVDEIEAWREDEKGNEVDENFNHAMASGRYLLWGMLGIYNDPGALMPDREGDVARMLEHQAVPSILEDAGSIATSALEDETAWMSSI